MKNLKKIIAMGLTAALCAVSLAGCGGTQNGGTDGATDTNAKDTYKIGVLQYADHLSLDNCRFTRYGPCMRYRNTVCTGLLQCGL